TGGKPIISLPAFVIIAFELTILFGALSTVVGLFINARLPRARREVVYDPSFSAGKFGIFVAATDTRIPEAAGIMRESGAEQVRGEPLPRPAPRARSRRRRRARVLGGRLHVAGQPARVDPDVQLPARGAVLRPLRGATAAAGERRPVRRARRRATAAARVDGGRAHRVRRRRRPEPAARGLRRARAWPGAVPPLLHGLPRADRRGQRARRLPAGPGPAGHPLPDG